MRRRRRKRVLYPLLSRECEDVSMVEHIDWKWLDPENGERGADMDRFCKEISKIRELGTSVALEVIRGLYNEQERAVKILGHQVVDGGAQERRARRTLANEQGGQTQYKVQLGKHDSVERAPQDLTGPWIQYIRAEAGPRICLHTSIMHARPGRSLLGADLGTRGKAS